MVCLHPQTNELVDLLNTVDATYRHDLRQLNELNFARFDAKLEQRIAEVNARIDSLASALRAELHSLRSDVRADTKELKAELIKWMFLFWAGTALAGMLLK